MNLYVQYIVITHYMQLAVKKNYCQMGAVVYTFLLVISKQCVLECGNIQRKAYLSIFIIKALQSSYCLVPMPHLIIGHSKLVLLKLSSGLHQAVFSVVFELTHVIRIFKRSHH